MPTEVDRDAIESVVAAAAAAQSDPVRLLELHTRDTVVVNIAGRRVLGRDELGEAMTAALASPLADVRTTVEVVDVRFPTKDTAVVSCTKTVHDQRSGDHAPLPAAGALTYLMVRAGNLWHIAVAQTTPIATPPRSA